MSKSTFLSGMILGALTGAAGLWLFQTYQTQASYGTCLQTYPNIPGKLLLENDKVVVQHFTFPPDQWEGVHAHPANQLYIHLTDAHWKSRFGDQTSTGSYPAGSIGWYGPVSLAEDHESINMGENPIELIWVTLKEGCQATT
ncbi:hypothetical protein ROA7450_00045 [Roseovarius albus]|uniref:Cupin domain protein n=1 Tax=Roseovarius albus TaxID=1247867 RepID=A0A1X6Y502_9RHOB|nr:hypothetical protein [Roseovarius albus]SLN10852.1 hypothetical protein ROA7450_00045 [Roseovarius albus]